MSQAWPPWLWAYNTLLAGGLPLWMGYLTWQTVRLPRLRVGWRERWGRLPPAVEALAGRPRLIWFHAVSVGEVKAAAPVVREVLQRLPQAPILLSTVTATGRATALQELKGLEGLFFLPWDLPFVVASVVGRLRPALLVTVETEWWPNLLHWARSRGAQVALINGRVSDRSFARWRLPLLRPLARSLLETYHLLCVQTDQDAQRLVALGADPKKVKVLGNTKADTLRLSLIAPEEAVALAEMLGITPPDPVLVAGSTGPGEEAILLEAFLRIRQIFPTARLIVVPRQIDRAQEILALARARNLPALLRTELPQRQIYSLYERPVIVVNTTGELARLYSLATVAFVGRSLVPMGGSNLLEALVYGCPVLMGPHMENFAEMAQFARENQLAFVVRNASDIVKQFQYWCCQERERLALGRRAREFLLSRQGAARRTAEELLQLLPA